MPPAGTALPDTAAEAARAVPAAQGVDDSDSRYQDMSQQQSVLGLTHLVFSSHQTTKLGSATETLISS